MAPRKATKRQQKGKSSVDEQLKEKAAAALKRERKQVVQRQEGGLVAMRSELTQWCQSHPQALEYIHRGCFLGTCDNLDNPEASTSESAKQGSSWTG